MILKYLRILAAFKERVFHNFLFIKIKAHLRNVRRAQQKVQLRQVLGALPIFITLEI